MASDNALASAGFVDFDVQTSPYYDAPKIANVPDDVLLKAISDMARDGVAVIPDFLLAGLGTLREFVSDAVDANGGQYTCFTGAETLAGTPFGDIAQMPAFVRLMRRVYELGLGKPAPAQSLYQVLRCLKGSSGLKHSMNFHYDSYVVTALLPVHIPTSGKTGDLVVLKYRRGVRPFYVLNLLDKIILDNRFTQSLLKYINRTGGSSLKRVKIVPGNLYLFWGYRTVHANESCDIDQLRATALYHFGDPHVGSPLRRYTGKADARAAAPSGN
jgi:hypothetical protein